MELKPCPFCGGIANEHSNYISCDNNNCSTCPQVINSQFPNSEQRKLAWNTRPIEDELRKRIIELAQFNVELREKVIIAIGEIEKQLKKLKEA